MIYRRLLIYLQLVYMFIIVPIYASPFRDTTSILDPINALLSKLEIIDDNYEETVEYLVDLLEYKIDLNTTNAEELTRLLILTPQQINAILNYAIYNDGYNSVFELQFIYNLDKETILLIAPFLTVDYADKIKDKSKLKDILKYPRQSFITRFDVPLYNKKGFGTTYYGPSFYHSIRYNMESNRRLYIGFSAEKDSGEPIFGPMNKQGYDFYSYYLYLKDWKYIKYFMLGKYRIHWGLGLTIGTSSFGSKYDQMNGFFLSSNRIYKHSSVDEYSYLNGTAISLKMNNLYLSGFLSQRAFDGVIDKGIITKQSKTGLHRTASEIERKGGIKNRLYGVRLSLSKLRYSLGIHFINYSYNGSFETTSSQLYTAYDPVGNNFYNVGIDYTYAFQKVIIKGEIAKGKRGFATLNYLYYAPTSSNEFLLSYRYYAKDYWGEFANSFGNQSKVRNENGVYISYSTTSLPAFKIQIYADYCVYPWLKYRVSKPSNSLEFGARIGYSFSYKQSLLLTYKFRKSERDLAGSKGTVLHRVDYQNIKLQYLLGIKEWVDMKLFSSFVRSVDKEVYLGYHIGGRVSFQTINSKFKIDNQVSYFNTQSHDSRVYIFENSLLYHYSSLSFSGRGYRASINLNYKPFKWIHFMCKVGATKYLDRMVIGTGNDEIVGNLKADVQFQVKFKL